VEAVIPMKFLKNIASFGPAILVAGRQASLSALSVLSVAHVRTVNNKYTAAAPKMMLLRSKMMLNP